MDTDRFLAKLQAAPDYAGQIVHVEDLPARPARYGKLANPLPPPLLTALGGLEITDLYTHQVACMEAVRAGRHAALVTGTASGKTLAYALPVLERLLEAPARAAFWLYPTKALAQDQLRGLHRLAELSPGVREVLRTGTYDGDTPPASRRKLRDAGNVILTNPDMLHAGILPYHAKWARALANLDFVVLDEIHAYRGIFGSNVANVVRRLRRICRHYGSDPVFILCSATIANPAEHAEALVGDAVTLIDDDGAPRGAKRFVLWNPPAADGDPMHRVSSNVEAHRLLTELVKERVPSICFSRSRVVAELIYRYTQEALTRGNPDLAGLVRAYRGGYLPRERREIERALFSGRLLAVSSTNALELGIDVGGLDAALVVGFPSTIASLWQELGRAGRGNEDALAVFIAYNDPVDQYLVRHPDYLLSRTPERAVLDPGNPYILANHLQCAAFELPLGEDDPARFGERAGDLVRLLEASGLTRRIDEKSYWATPAFPARRVNLRHMSQDTYTIVAVVPEAGRGSAYRPETGPDFAAPGRGEAAVLGNVDAISALELLYPEAVYLHEGETYVVRRLDLEGKTAFVERREVDYYTVPVLDQSVLLLETRETASLSGCALGFGDVTVTWFTSFFKKIQFLSVDSIGYGILDLPPQDIETTAFWLAPPAELRARLRAAGKNPVEGLAGVRNLLVSVVSLHAMCDRADLGGVVESRNLGTPAVFLYDRYPGGLGFAEQAFRRPARVLADCLALVEECPCAAGCPSCVGLPVLRPAQHQDPEIGRSWPIPDKDTARRILRELVPEEARSPGGVARTVGAEPAP